MRPASQRWLRTGGWLGALAGFLLALWSPAQAAGGLHSGAGGHRPIALLGLGVLLLGLGRMMGRLAPPATRLRIGCYTIVCGATWQAIGTLGRLAIPALGWLGPIGAVAVLAGLLPLLRSPAWSPRAGEMKFLPGIVCLGVALDALLTVASLDPTWLARISHHLPTEARDRPASTSLRLLAVLNVLSSTPALVKRRAPRTDAPLTHFASPRGEKCGLGIEWASTPDALQTRLLRLARSAAMILPVVAAPGHDRDGMRRLPSSR